jgi:hypothetical protein
LCNLSWHYSLTHYSRTQAMFPASHLVRSPRTATHRKHPLVVEPRCCKVILPSHVAFHGPPSCPRRAGHTASALSWYMNAQIFVVSSVSVVCLGFVDPMHYGRFLFRDRGGCAHLSIAISTEHPPCSILESREATSTSCISMGQIRNPMDYCRWGQKERKLKFGLNVYNARQ